MSVDEPHTIEGIRVVPEATDTLLNNRQRLDYQSHRKRLIKWMCNVGKNPDQAEGYAYETARRRAYDCDTFYRWVWDENGGYTTQITHDHADAYMKELAYSDESDSYKANVEKTIKMLFKWRAWEFTEDEWEPEITFNATSTPSQPRDFLTRDERRAIREAALEYGSVPHYNSLDPHERREWKRYLAHRFRKPMNEITKADFERANGFKIVSLIWTALDIGARPVEIKRARVGWVDTDNAVLRIPANEAAKSNENWAVSIQQRTAKMLARWLEERQLYEKYDGTDRLWLTRESNPYQSHSLNYVLRKLCEIAGIEMENRQMSFYSIRHSVGTLMTREEGLAAAQSQLRHQSERTTMKYDNASVSDRRSALDRMG